jgi:hypothetical protein
MSRRPPRPTLVGSESRTPLAIGSSICCGSRTIAKKGFPPGVATDEPTPDPTGNLLK